MKLPDFFRNNQGRVVIWQSPNLLLLIWIVATVLTIVLEAAEPQQLFRTIAKAAIIAWATLEITLGDSYFRRSLGLAVLILTLMPLFE